MFTGLKVFSLTPFTASDVDEKVFSLFETVTRHYPFYRYG